MFNTIWFDTLYTTINWYKLYIRVWHQYTRIHGSCTCVYVSCDTYYLICLCFDVRHSSLYLLKVTEHSIVTTRLVCRRYGDIVMLVISCCLPDWLVTPSSTLKCLKADFKSFDCVKSIFTFVGSLYNVISQSSVTFIRNHM